ncbi:hypothetical protein OHS33_39130 (plasmid) [Streptomyces sp. NBC_00536]|uniref:hypothetical protein n=1 Tax=Streptomyces sp. NBC_00536 TaxID=2975769 RepID=UPI002E818657|nr:hypothetical protein [Streptomyces sp. NBC_00536]WUC84373.1 hypothetical protein OHS33_39130 [Streptomyces sp. NBC_00536]
MSDNLNETRPAAPADTERRYEDAAELFAALHPAAEQLTRGLQDNARDTVREGGSHFTAAEVWGQIGQEPGQRLAWDADDNPEEWATAEGFTTAWTHINRLAAAGPVDVARWDELVTEARDILAAASTRVAPVTLAKQPASWQVLWYAESPLSGERWADLPVHSIVRTAQLRAGQDWNVVDGRLDARGLKRYGIRAVSAGDALVQARARWEQDGPFSGWWAFLEDDAPHIENMRATYEPTPEQERAAYEYAVAAVANPPLGLTPADLHAIANGQHPLA